MSAPRKVTVKARVLFNDMAMESTEAALEVIHAVVADLSSKYGAEIRQALEDAGAKDVTIHFSAY